MWQLYGDRSFKKAIKITQGHMGGSLSNLTGVLIRRGNYKNSPGWYLIEERLCKDIVGRWKSSNQGEKIQKKSNLLTLDLKFSSLQVWENKFLMFCHPFVIICYSSTFRFIIYREYIGNLCSILTTFIRAWN